MLWCAKGNAVLHPYVKDSGFLEVPHNGNWTPESTWLAK